jgi:hypothetical protein
MLKLIHIQPLRGCERWVHDPRASPGAIHIQPLRGWQLTVHSWFEIAQKGRSASQHDPMLEGEGVLRCR